MIKTFNTNKLKKESTINLRLNMKRRFILILLTLFLKIVAFAAVGTVEGTLIELQDGEKVPLPFANVYLEGTTIGSISDFDGNFTISAEPGEYIIVCKFLGYEPFKKPIVIAADGIISLNIEMKPEGIAIEGIDIVATMNRESDMALIMEQKDANVAIERIGAQQLAVQGVGDAAAGVAKVTGVTKQAGSHTINVRGLGDRYNSTTLNGLPLPSNHAEFKNINLELFSTDVIGYIGVEKVFTANLYGDVAGANINIVSKKHTGKSFFQIGVSSGSNSNLVGVDNFYLQDGPGLLGFDNFQAPVGEYVPTNYNTFQNNWNPKNVNTFPNLGISLRGGKKFDFSNGSSLSLFATASYDNKYSYSQITQNRVNGSDIYRQELAGEYFEFETQTSGMVNLNYSTKVTEIYFNSLVLNSSDQNMQQLEGYYIDIVSDGETAYLRRSNYERNLIFVNQLLGEHSIGETMELNWGVAYNNVHNLLPDRRNNIFVQNNTTEEYVSATNDQANNHRYWHDLFEDEIASNISIDKRFGSSLNDDIKSRGKVTVGYSGRYKVRDFNSYQYNHKINEDNYSDLIDIWNVDAYFNDVNMQQDNFALRTFYGNLNLPVTYTGTQILNAGFVQLEYNFNEKLMVLFGLRAESIYQSVDYKTTISTGSNSFDEFKVLPSLSLRYKATKKSNIRFSTSQSYTLPQFKETAPFQFEGITFSTIGNPYLYLSTNYNVDLKWELFPTSGELISVTAFGKYILNPINQFVMSSASNDFTYANTGDWAYVAGAEFDARKNLIKRQTESGSEKLFVGANLTLMHSKQELNNQKVSDESEGKYISSFNTETDVLQGAAPVIANVSLGYINKWDEGKSFTTSLIYAYTSDRLYLLGYAGAIGNQVDKGYSTLDFVAKTELNKFGISFTAMNILNQTIDRVQQNAEVDHVVLSYKKGVDFKLSVSYKF